jgi:hypothetical protein
MGIALLGTMICHSDTLFGIHCYGDEAKRPRAAQMQQSEINMLINYGWE